MEKNFGLQESMFSLDVVRALEDILSIHHTCLEEYDIKLFDNNLFQLVVENVLKGTNIKTCTQQK